MPDFAQSGAVTTIHDFGTTSRADLNQLLCEVTHDYKMGLVLPITAEDMRADPFRRIVDELSEVDFMDSVVVVLNRAPHVNDYVEMSRMLEPLGSHAHLLWTDGERGSALIQTLIDTGFPLDTPGKGRAVWLAFGYLLADPRLKAFALHDCDIVDYDSTLLARLCLPMAHPGLDFDYCKAYYARVTHRMHGRVARLLVNPLIRALIQMLGIDDYLLYLQSFRYPLSGEFAISSSLARSNRLPSDWGLEVGTLSEVYRNTALKRICQVDIGQLYEHKHQELSLEDPRRGLMKMALDILTSILRTLASRGTVFQEGHLATLRTSYLRAAQDAIRQYHADAIVNGLDFDRHSEEEAVEGFAEQVTLAGHEMLRDPAGGAAIPNWARVLTALPDFPHRLRECAAADKAEFGHAKEKV